MAVQASQPRAIALNEAELNQCMRDNLAIASIHQAQQAGILAPVGSEPSVQEVQFALKDVRMNLTGNQLQAYAPFALYGKEISLQLDGTIETLEGYVRLKPTAGKLGSLPIPSSTLNSVVHHLFDSPQNRDKLQLPPQIESIRIENNTLVIVTRWRPLLCLRVSALFKNPVASPGTSPRIVLSSVPSRGVACIL